MTYILIITAIILGTFWYLNYKSTNTFFEQEEKSIREKLDLIVKIWTNLDFSTYDIVCLSAAFEYFIKNPKEYNGTSIINDFWLIKGLEPESVIHDCDWIHAQSLRCYMTSNEEYCQRLRRRNAQWLWVWCFIFVGLTIVSLFKSIKFINLK